MENLAPINFSGYQLCELQSPWEQSVVFPLKNHQFIWKWDMNKQCPTLFAPQKYIKFLHTHK